MSVGLVSYVVTARDESPPVLARTLTGLLGTTADVRREVIVVDDGSAQPVGGLAPEVHLIRNAAPIGVSRSRRCGAALATGDAIVWLDAHMTFERDWLERMLDHVDSGALLCSAAWDYEREVCHCWGADFTWSAERAHEQQRHPGFGLRHRTSFPGTGAVQVPAVLGACYMMQRLSYDRTGGFSPLLRVWGADEQDLSARAWLAGCGVLCVTDAAVGHLWRPQFPYPVQFDHLEFNQLSILRTVFDERTQAALAGAFEPVPETVSRWLREANLTWWRDVVQVGRRLNDLTFLDRFLPEVAALVRSSGAAVGPRA